MFSASLTFLLITWRRHLLSKNPQSSVRGDEVGKCTVRSACFLVPHAGSIQPKIPEISVQNSIQPGKFSQKKKKKKNLVHPLRWTTFLGRTGRKFWLNWSRPWCPHMKLKWSAFKHVRSAIDSLISAGLYIFQKPITGGSALRGCQHISLHISYVPIAL